MSELSGVAVIVKIPVAGTPTALPYEIEGNLQVDPEFATAINKGTSGWVARLAQTRGWRLEVSSHIDDTTNTVLDVVVAAALASTLLEGVQMAVGTAWTLEGDGTPSLGIRGAAQDFGQLNFTITGSGALAQS